MNKWLLLLLAMVFTVGSVYAWGRDTYVQGYTRSNGTYVQGYHRTAPDNNVYNNYSTRGNVNPYTGQQGQVTPRPQYNGIGGYQQPAYGNDSRWSSGGY